MLAGAAALLATGASAQTLEKVWEKNSGVPGVAAGGEMRFMSCDKDGKILVTDKANKKIMTFNALFGAQDYLDIAPIIDQHYGVDGKAIDRIDTIVSEANDTTFDTIMKDVRTVPGAGTLVASDDAGNILINTGFPNAASATDFIIIAANLKDSYKLQITMPEGVTAARCDQMGRIVGDMLSDEGAYMWICCNGATNVAIVKVVNGEQDMDYSQASTKCAVAVNTSCVAQPVYNTVAEIDALMDDNGDLTPSFWFRNRSYPQNVYQWNEDATEQVAITLTEAFAERTEPDFHLTYEAEDAMVMVIREDTEGLMITLEEYTEMVQEANDLTQQVVTSRDDYMWMEYTAESDGLNFYYLAACYCTEDSCWIITFATPVGQADAYKEVFLTWADSVTFNDTI